MGFLDKLFGRKKDDAAQDLPTGPPVSPAPTAPPVPTEPAAEEPHEHDHPHEHGEKDHQH
jgi:hypothetical protein